MPDYQDTVKNLDALRKEQIEKNKSLTVPTFTKVGKITVVGARKVPNPKADEIGKEEAQYATLEKAAKRTQNDLNDAHEKFKEALKSGDADPAVLDDLSHKATTLRKRMEYFNHVAEELGGSGFEVLTGPKSVAIGEEARKQK